MLTLIKKILKTFLVVATFSNLLFSFIIDPSLPIIKELKLAKARSSIGLEWRGPDRVKEITAINIYRATINPNSKQHFYERIATVNRFATHYVDTKLRANTEYLYTLTTLQGLKESLYGTSARAKTKPPYSKVKLVEAYVLTKNTVKVIWIPNIEPQIYKYIIQRRRKSSKLWFDIGEAKGRLMPEYIDTTALMGESYEYRVFAVDIYGMGSIVSDIKTVRME